MVTFLRIQTLGNVLNVEPDKVAIGQRVELAWDAVNDETKYPAFNVVEA